MRFTEGYAACCVCSPTRGSIMTGKYPPRFGITDWIPGSKSPDKLISAANVNRLPLEEVTIEEAFRGAGYTTFFAGKWHLGGGNFSQNSQGFGPGLFSSDGNQFWYPPSTVPPPDAKADPKTTDRIVNEAVSFIAAQKDKPFFIYLPFLAVHNKIGAREDLVAKCQRKKASAPADASGQEGERKVNLVQNNAVYAAMHPMKHFPILTTILLMAETFFDDAPIPLLFVLQLALTKASQPERCYFDFCLRV